MSGRNTIVIYPLNSRKESHLFTFIRHIERQHEISRGKVLRGLCGRFPSFPGRGGGWWHSSDSGLHLNLFGPRAISQF